MGGAQSPTLSFAVSKLPHLRDLMSETRRLVSIDLSDTWGSCQTHLHSEASTHTSTHTETRTGNKAGRTSAFPLAAGLDSLTKSQYSLVSRLPGRMFVGAPDSGEPGHMNGAELVVGDLISGLFSASLCLNGLQEALLYCRESEG